MAKGSKDPRTGRSRTSGDEDDSSQGEQARRQVQEQIDEIVERRTGDDASEATPEEVERALRNEAIEGLGAGRLLESRVIGADPMEVTDEELADRARELAAKMHVGALVDKDPDEVSAADFAKVQEQILEGEAELRTGRPLSELSAVERMRLESDLRNEAFDRQVGAGSGAAGGAAQEAASGSGSGGVASQAAAVAADSGVQDAAVGAGARIADGLLGGTGGSDTGGSGSGAAGGAASTVQESVSDAGNGAGSSAQEAVSSPPEAAADQSSSVGGGASAGGETVGAMFHFATGSVNADTSSSDYGEGTLLSFYRTEDGQWYDEGGNLVTGEGNLAVLEGAWEDYQEHGGTASDAGEVAPSGTTFEDAVKAATGGDDDEGDGDSAGTSQGGTSDSGSSDSESSDSDSSDSGESDGSSDDSSDDDDDGDDGEDDGDEEASSEETATDTAEDSSEEDSGDGAGGDEGTPHPDYVPEDPAALAAFLDSPLGRETRERDERGIDLQRSGGVIDPAEDGGGGGGGGPVRFVGGAIDPADGFEPRSGGGAIDEMRLPGAGITDPPEPGGSGSSPVDNPLVGGAGPVTGGGLRSDDLDFGAGAAVATGGYLAEDDDGDGVDDDEDGSVSAGDVSVAPQVAAVEQLGDHVPEALGLQLSDVSANLDVDAVDDQLAD